LCVLFFAAPRAQPPEIRLLRTEEGRYSALCVYPYHQQNSNHIFILKNNFPIALGDPLIKGLTEVTNQRPGDPIAFLTNYLRNFSKGASSEERVSEMCS
jgi:hypothetical protein